MKGILSLDFKMEYNIEKNKQSPLSSDFFLNTKVYTEEVIKNFLPALCTYTCLIKQAQLGIICLIKSNERMRTY